jgi:primosomal protein N' (replication factor Y)
MTVPRATFPPPESPVARRVAVCVPLPLAGPYDYLVPEGMAVAPGDLVRVPVGGRVLWGAAWGAAAGGVAEARLKPVQAVSDLPPLSPALRRFVDWVAAYTVSPPGAVLRMVLSSPAALEAETPATGVVRAAGWPKAARRTPARQRLWTARADAPPLAMAEAARVAGCPPPQSRGSSTRAVWSRRICRGRGSSPRRTRRPRRRC